MTISDLIKQNGVKINHAAKVGNTQLADQLKTKLKNYLDKKGYNWEADPYALELLEGKKPLSKKDKIRKILEGIENSIDNKLNEYSDKKNRLQREITSLGAKLKTVISKDEQSDLENGISLLNKALNSSYFTDDEEIPISEIF